MSKKAIILIIILLAVLGTASYVLLFMGPGNCQRDCIQSLANRKEGISDCGKNRSCRDRYKPICKKFCQCVKTKAWDICEIEAGLIPQNWKTYQDQQYNFEVKYPSTWQVSTESEEEYAKIVGGIVITPLSFKKLMKEGGGPAFSFIGAYQPSEKLRSVRDVADVRIKGFKKGSPDMKYETKEVVFAGREGVRAHFKNQILGSMHVDSEKGVKGNVIIYWLPRAEKGWYEVSCAYTLKRIDTDKPICNQILSTFKFLE